MSLDFRILLDDDSAPAEIQVRLQTMTGFELSLDFKSVKCLKAPGLRVSIWRDADVHDSAGAAGIVTKTVIGLDNNDKDRKPEWNINSMRVLLAILHAYPGDVLFMELENPALLRKRGRIILDNAHGTWNDDVEPNLRAMLDLPYEFGEIKMSY